jgi:hypothetical protein
MNYGSRKMTIQRMPQFMSIKPSGGVDMETQEEGAAQGTRNTDQSGGVNISGGKNTFRGDVVGRDKIVSSTESGLTSGELNQLLQPLLEAVRAASPEKQAQAEEKVAVLKEELTKGEKADDTLVAKLLDGIVELVPGAVSAVTALFATPILSGLSGPVTKFVLEKLTGK